MTSSFYPPPHIDHIHKYSLFLIPPTLTLKITPIITPMMFHLKICSILPSILHSSTKAEKEHHLATKLACCQTSIANSSTRIAASQANSHSNEFKRWRVSKQVPCYRQSSLRSAFSSILLCVVKELSSTMPFHNSQERKQLLHITAKRKMRGRRLKQNGFVLPVICINDTHFFST
jgi:hypothetical protein